MATELPHTPIPQTVDLTGLPERVVRQVMQIVQAARQEQPGEAAGEGATFPTFLSRPRLSSEESRRLLDEMASRSSGQALPTDFSRADIYDDPD